MTQRVHGGESAQEKNAAVPGLLRLLPMWLVRPSSQWTFTICLPPVSPAHTYPLWDLGLKRPSTPVSLKVAMSIVNMHTVCARPTALS
jgi:hypothetical protein